MYVSLRIHSTTLTTEKINNTCDKIITYIIDAKQQGLVLLLCNICKNERY